MKPQGKQYIIASSRKWSADMAHRLSERSGKKFLLIDNRLQLTFENLKTFDPRYVFFPHWSYIIPSEIYENIECVIFHMTDVPFGRGGSPLQNLIVRGIYETKLSALRCAAGIDTGPVYMKKTLSLHGSAEEIFLRAGSLMEEMILEMVEKEPVPVEQEGDVVLFKRRKPEDGDLAQLKELQEVFDYIRMLDAEGYPNAFLETENFRLEFKRADMRQGSVTADVVITRKK